MMDIGNVLTWIIIAGVFIVGLAIGYAGGIANGWGE